jgi:hypothetical protein
MFAVSLQEGWLHLATTLPVRYNAENRRRRFMMTCVHLKKLFDLCSEEDLKIGGSDLVRIVCKQCGEQEVCPSVLMEEYEAQHPEEPDPEATEES